MGGKGKQELRIWCFLLRSWFCFEGSREYLKWLDLCFYILSDWKIDWWGGDS